MTEQAEELLIDTEYLREVALYQKANLIHTAKDFIEIYLSACRKIWNENPTKDAQIVDRRSRKRIELNRRLRAYGTAGR